MTIMAKNFGSMRAKI